MLPNYLLSILALGAMFGSSVLAEPIPVADGAIEEATLDIQDVEFDSLNDLEARAALAGSCSNDGKIKRVKKEYGGSCHPNNSLGFKSAHNCYNKSGKSYLCVQNKKATCYKSGIKNLNMENGECFKTK